MTYVQQTLTSEDIYNEIGKRIATARLASGLTQTDLGEAISLSRTSITNIEGGRQKILIHTLFDIAAALHVDVKELLPQPTDSTETMTRRGSLDTLDQAARTFIEQTLRSGTEEAPS